MDRFEGRDQGLDPSVQTLPEFRKVFVACLGADPSVQRVAGVRKEVTWTPGMYPSHYRSFCGYWISAYDPGTMRTGDGVPRYAFGTGSFNDRLPFGPPIVVRQKRVRAPRPTGRASRRR
ncbi:MAG: hypothetical protein EYC70_12195 [Planctomycetota bacterium]|nr:MAG: hypothetical protein EYC70_12195 [Planctomycetota bacterium]